MQRLARLKSSASTTPATVLTGSPMAAPATATHVLIADANARTLAARGQQLLAAGLRVSLAHTAFEAIVKACCHLPDMILLDGSLADLDATAAGQMLTTCPTTSHIPVVTLTPGRRVPQRIVAATRRLGL